MAAAPTYRHQSLTDPSKNIRLLRVLSSPIKGSSTRNDPIQCSLEEGDLESEYSCLSYIWGTSKASKQILIDGIPFMVGDNFFDFLLQTRRTRCILD